MNFIVGKRQIILASLVLALGIAIYLNWTFTDSGKSFIASNTVSPQKNYGDAQYVNNQSDGEAKSSDDYFAQARLTRDKTRAQSEETLKNMLSEATDADQQTALTLQANALAQTIEAEGKIENMIKAKGFSDCMVYYDGEKVDVVVKSEGLLDNEVAQIQEIILKETDVPSEKISIVEVK